MRKKEYDHKLSILKITESCLDIGVHYTVHLYGKAITVQSVPTRHTA